jgi:cob(I)alamin adenosyltransferase
LIEKAPPVPRAAKVLQKGLVQIYTGDGKGKTTAALGTLLRALGHGMKIYVAVFMKGDYPYGEWEFLARQPNIKIERFGLRTFCDPKNVKPEEIEQAEKALAAARTAMLSGKYDVVMLDEVNVAVGWKLVKLEDVLQLVKDKPEKVELILTGRRADPALVQLADLVTEMVNIKHPYEKGIQARQGIEY